MVSGRRGFSLIELMTVVVIIAILGSMILGAASIFGGGSPRARTQAILALVSTAVAERATELGSAELLAPHPFANKGAIDSLGLSRSLWVRANGGSVAQTGMAYECATDAWAPGGESAQILKNDDRFVGAAASGDLPFLYGVKRFKAHILGSGKGLNEYRRISAAAGAPGGHDDPREYQFIQRDRADLSDPSVLEDAAQRHLSFVLGSHYAALESLGGLQAAVAGDGSQLAVGNKIRLYTGDDDVSPVYRAGRLWTNSTAGTAWYRYRLRGLAIVDGWGAEVLYFKTAGGFCLASGGADGALRWLPGPNGIYDTAAHAELRSGDDLDALPDNVLEGNWHAEPPVY